MLGKDRYKYIGVKNMIHFMQIGNKQSIVIKVATPAGDLVNLVVNSLADV